MAGMFGFWSRHKANLTAARAGRDELLRQRDIAIGERNELMRQRDIALGERNELLDQRNKALNEREAFLRQRDVALGEANEFRRQRDLLLIENEQLKAEIRNQRAKRPQLTVGSAPNRERWCESIPPPPNSPVTRSISTAARSRIPSGPRMLDWVG